MHNNQNRLVTTGAFYNLKETIEHLKLDSFNNQSDATI